MFKYFLNGLERYSVWNSIRSVFTKHCLMRAYRGVKSIFSAVHLHVFWSVVSLLPKSQCPLNTWLDENSNRFSVIFLEWFLLGETGSYVSEAGLVHILCP